MVQKYFNFNYEQTVIPFELNEETNAIVATFGNITQEFESVASLAEQYALARDVNPEDLKRWTLVENGDTYSFVLQSAIGGISRQELKAIVGALSGLVDEADYEDEDEYEDYEDYEDYYEEDEYENDYEEVNELDNLFLMPIDLERAVEAIQNGTFVSNADRLDKVIAVNMLAGRQQIHVLRINPETLEFVNATMEISDLNRDMMQVFDGALVEHLVVEFSTDVVAPQEEVEEVVEETEEELRARLIAERNARLGLR